MLDALDFIRGTIGKKDLVPVFTHCLLKDNTVLSSNGKLIACHPLEAGSLHVAPKTSHMLSAIKACGNDEIITLSKTPKKFVVSSGAFKAYIDCLPVEEYPIIAPHGKVIPCPEDFLNVLKKLAPLIAEDASRPWARGILFREEYACATTNIVLIEYTLPFSFPVSVNVPELAIKELLRIGKNPIAIQIAEDSITFRYANNAWLKTAILNDDWPDLAKILDQETNPCPISETFFEALTSLAPLSPDDKIYFLGDRIATSPVEGEGAQIKGEFPSTGIYSIEQLKLIETFALSADFTLYPKPCLFFGENCRGAIIGRRV